MSSQSAPALPQPFTTLVGREHDIATIAALLEPATGSLLTLVGPAGVGKTRLAIAVASRLADRFADGVVYVDLAAVTDPDQVLPILGSAIGLPDGDGPIGRLARVLANRSVLLVIDNFEQVLDAAPMLNACLAGAPGVRTLITSQAPLRVRGEREFAVAPLPLAVTPDRGQLSEDDVRAIGRAPAVELFVRRAQAVRPAFQLTVDNVATVTEICRQLDGLPLAIELAAARSNVLSPQALLARLSAPLQLLNSGPRDVPDRHRALQSAIAWSYHLLSPDEAILFERLSVFSGSFSLSAVEAVAGNAPIVFQPSFYAQQADVPPLEPELNGGVVFDLLDGLVDHSLVQRFDGDAQEPRFRLYSTIRQFAREQLHRHGSGHAIGLRHATWFRAQAEAVWTAGGIPVLEWEWLGPLEHDIDNFRAALEWLTEFDPATATTLAAALGWHFYFFGRRNEGIRAFERSDNRFDPAVLSPVNRARNHYIRGILLVQFRDRENEGIAHFEAMLAEVEAIGLDWAIGFALLSLGVSAEDSGDYERALELLRRARPLLDALNEIATTANVDIHIASSLFGLGRLAEARALAEPIVALHPDIAGANLVYGLRLLGVMSMVEGDLPQAASLLRRYLDVALRYDMGKISTEAVDATATIAVRAGDPETGARLFGTADRVNLDADYAIHYPELPIYAGARQIAMDTLGPDRFEALYRAGTAIGFEAAVTLVREVLDSLVVNADSTGLRTPAAGKPATSPLTRREREVLQLVASGLTDREIADQLFIGHRTVRTHVGNILAKLDVPSRSAATSYALREGILRFEDAP